VRLQKIEKRVVALYHAATDAMESPRVSGIVGTPSGITRTAGW